MMVIHTSESGWLERLAHAYNDRLAVRLVDDANVGIDPAHQTLIVMAQRARFSVADITGVAVALGMSGIGVGLIVGAFLDPEPTSKLGLAMAGGVVLVASGGGTAIYILTRLRPPNVRMGPSGIEISWV